MGDLKTITKRGAVALAAAAVLAIVPRPHVRAGNATQWSPAGIAPAAISVDEILSRYAAGRARDGVFLERYRLRSSSASVDVSSRTNGYDFRVDADIDGAHYAMGRTGGKRWRETPAGTVRIIAADVQGDDLDRWPESVLGFDRAACDTAGQTSAEWVVHCEPAHDIPHWLYVSKNSGQVVRETVREGSRVTTFAFDEFRPSPAGPLPYHWSIAGSGGDADVTLASVARADDAAGFAIPKTSGEVFALSRGVEHLQVPARSIRGLSIPLTINGVTMDVPLDTGTTQILVDVGEAARLGLHAAFNHVVAHNVRIGGMVARDLPIETADLFGGRLKAIVGNEFFKGHIVHLNYGSGAIDVLPRDGFTAPADALPVAVNYDEGMPLVPMTVGKITCDRVALDTGSQILVLGPSYLRQDNPVVFPGGFGRGGYMNFLEGPLLVQRGGTASVSVGPFTIEDAPANVVMPDKNSLAIPIDGIIGTQILSHFELWFDYDGNRLWMRPAE